MRRQPQFGNALFWKILYVQNAVRFWWNQQRKETRQWDNDIYINFSVHFETGSRQIFLFQINKLKDKTNNNSNIEMRQFLLLSQHHNACIRGIVLFLLHCMPFSVASLILKWLTAVLLSCAVKSHNWMKLVCLSDTQFRLHTEHWTKMMAWPNLRPICGFKLHTFIFFFFEKLPKQFFVDSNPSTNNNDNNGNVHQHHLPDGNQSHNPTERS